MDSFFGTPKSVLQDTIRVQQERIGKYEKKLGDLIKAYKCLQDEKKALQETVTALSATEGEGTSEGESSGSKQQIIALTKSLASLNETKNTLESRYQFDKRDMLEQIEKLKADSLADKSRFSRERDNLEGQTREMKTKLRHEQYEREQEQTHHVAMLREIQQMLATERARSQRAEAETSEEAEGRRKERSLQEDKVKLLIEEKNYLTKELENCRSTPNNRIMELEQELEDLRSCKSELDELRQDKTDTSHHNMRTSTEQHRIRDLENRVTELSELVSDYDRRQQRDQREIERLMSRVTVLESEEKRVLPSAAPTVNVNVNTIVNTHPVTTPSPAASPSPIIPATAGELRELASVEVARRKEELQIYKGETERLRSEKVRLHTNLVDISEQHKLALSELSLQHELQIREMEKGHTSHLADLQESSNKARNRAQELLTERECEIAELKGQLENRSNKRPSNREEGVFGELLGSSEDSPRTLIFYKQQHEYLLEDLGKMKGLRETMEQSLREKERNEHVYVGEIAKLAQENRRLTRNTSRESANMEYLKNIIVRYLSLGNGSERRQVLSAVLTVLQLTPDEVNKVKHKLSPGWFC